MPPKPVYKITTHLPVLAVAVACTKGPVLEIGCGYCSTIFLHQACRQMCRPLDSVESDPAWIRRLIHMEHSLHRFYDRNLIPDWRIFAAAGVAPSWGKWNLALIDQWPAEDRRVSIEVLRGSVGAFIVHDTEPEAAEDYGFEPLLANFKYRQDWTYVKPWTTVVSDSIDVRNWFNE